MANPKPAIITQTLRGDRRAQAALYREFAPYGLAVIRRFGIARQSEADLLQEIFIEVFAKLHRFDPERGEFTTWLRSITVYRIIDHQRRSGNFDTLALDTIAEPAATDLTEYTPAYLLRMIGALPAGYRTVFNLFAVEGFSHERIGKLLGISAEGSRSQYFRARKALQGAIRNHQKKIADAS